MYFFEDVCMASDEDIAYCEAALEFGVLHHQTDSVIAMYEQSLFTEDGDSGGLLQKVKDSILKILDKIDSIIKGFLDGFCSLSNNRLDAETYMNSEAAQIRLSEDLFAMQRDIDEEYLKMRPIISKIHNLTGTDLQKVANVCDTVTEKIHDNRDTIKYHATKIVKGVAVRKLSDHCARQLKSVQGWNESIRKGMEELGIETPEQKKEKIKQGRQEKRDRMKENVKVNAYGAKLKVEVTALNAAVKAVDGITNAYIALGNKARSIMSGKKK